MILALGVGMVCCVCVFLQSVNLTSLTDKGSNNNGEPLLNGWNELLENQWPMTTYMSRQAFIITVGVKGPAL